MKTAFRRGAIALLLALFGCILIFGIAACGQEADPTPTPPTPGGDGPSTPTPTPGDDEPTPTPTPETVTYTVHVVCADDVLGGVHVRILHEETEAGESALTDGTAQFSLEAGDYTATLTGVPQGYTFEDAVLTEAAPEATITVNAPSVTPPPPPAEQIAYTVTVVCSDDVLTGVRVQLMAGADLAGETPLVNGKAEFLLAPGTYSVVLVGLPEGYSAPAATVSAEAPTALVAVTGSPLEREYSYEVTLTYSQATDVFGGTHAAGPAAGIPVTLYESELSTVAVASKNTDAEGKVQFTLTGKSYYVAVSARNYRIPAKAVRTLTAEAPALTLALEAKGVFGSQEAPLTLTVGENAVPLTKEILNAYGSVAYLFVPPATATYYFTTSSALANVTAEIFPEGIVGAQKDVSAALKADMPYLIYASSRAEEGDLSYTLTISDTPAPPEEVDPDEPLPENPWEGEGTKAAPYAVKNLVGKYEVPVAWDGESFAEVWFTYTAQEAGHYAAKGVSGDYLVSFNSGRFFINPGSPSVDFTLEAGETLSFCVSNFNEDSTSSFTAVFEIAVYVAPPAALGSIEKPEDLSALLGKHTFRFDGQAYFYRYTETAGTSYLATTAYAGGIHITFRLGPDAKIEDKTILPSIDVAAGATERFTLEAGKTYVIGVSSDWDAGFGREDQTEKEIDFTVTEVTGEEEPGTEGNPFVIADIVGTHTFRETNDGHFYTFTVKEAGDYVFTANSPIYLKEVDGTLSFYTPSSKTQTISLKARTYVVKIMTYGGVAEGEVSFTVEKKAAAPTALEGEYALPAEKH